METSSEFINWAKKELGDVTEVVKEPHGNQSDVRRLHTTRETFFLKVGKNLSREKDKLDWLQGKISVPEVKAFTTIGDLEALLLTAVEGKNLAHLAKEWSSEKVVKELVIALQVFHSVSTDGCPFGQPGPDTVLVHGDACLPNFIFNGDTFSGYIDLGDMCVGSKEIDLAAGVWSLQYNLGKGFGASFLEQYGLENVTEETVEDLRLKYEDAQKEWFPEDYQDGTNALPSVK